MSYLGRSGKLSLKAQEKVSFLATAGQTVKTGLSYTPSFVEVYVNGVLLTDTTDFTATNGSSITFTVALLLNDEVTVISLKTFTVADHYSKTEADTLLAAKATVANFTSTGIDDNATSTAVTIDASEKVTLSSTDSENLFIDGGHSTDASIKIKGAYHSNLYAKLTESAGQFIISADDGNQETNSCLRFKVKGTERMRLTPDGLTFNGDTAAANALDDYEEGTWTFAMTGSTGSVGSYTQAGAVGTYTKIGDMVYFNGTSYVSDKGSYTGNLIIEGLPFASNASTNVAASVSGLPISAFGANVYGALINADNTFITFRRGLYLDDTAAWSELTPNVRVYVSGSYKIA